MVNAGLKQLQGSSGRKTKHEHPCAMQHASAPTAAQIQYLTIPASSLRLKARAAECGQNGRRCAAHSTPRFTSSWNTGRPQGPR